MSELIGTTITEADVRRSLDRARAGLQAAAEEVVWQIENQAWVVLGYASWDEMREAEYGGAAFMVPTAARPQLVQRLRELGMSQREIARTAGVSQATVQGDLIKIDQPEPQPTRPGVNAWSRRVERVSAALARGQMGELTTEEVRELHGAATFLRDYCQGELIRRRTT